MASVEFGCGLIAIGRPWGTTPEVPSEIEAVKFLEKAYELGIRFFDTAPSYGLSERRLGIFLDQLSNAERDEITVATKFGEHWNLDTRVAYVDHTLEALKRSLDQSLRLLGQIAILQLHKTTTSLLGNRDLQKALEHVHKIGIQELGASVSDTTTADAVLRDERFDVMQLPFNQGSMQFKNLIGSSTGKKLLINRPLQMGQVVTDPKSNRQIAIESAFRFILKEHFNGVILTGTSNEDHLKENYKAFNKVKEGLGWAEV